MVGITLTRGPQPRLTTSMDFPAAAPEILYLGDSTIAGVGAHNATVEAAIAAYLPPDIGAFRAINLARSGATTADVLLDQLPRANDIDPSLVIVGAGTNDARASAGPNRLLTDTTALLMLLRRRFPRALILHTGVAPIDVAPAVPSALRDGLRERVEALNGEVRIACVAANVCFLDIAARLRAQFDGDDTLFSSDRLHPSDAGYDLCARTIADEVQRATTLIA
ncbi:MAG: hydrolase family protein [Thermoleophilia bacterium]|nr:hydrolase family protein [Thermoleophilia bacterium]